MDPSLAQRLQTDGKAWFCIGSRKTGERKMSRTVFETRDDLNAWERVKKAFANDWEQTKADFGVAGARDMGQDVDDTLKQMVGSDNAFENHEQAFRFGISLGDDGPRSIRDGRRNWMESCVGTMMETTMPMRITSDTPMSEMRAVGR